MKVSGVNLLDPSSGFLVASIPLLTVKSFRPLFFFLVCLLSPLPSFLEYTLSRFHLVLLENPESASCLKLFNSVKHAKSHLPPSFFRIRMGASNQLTPVNKT